MGKAIRWPKAYLLSLFLHLFVWGLVVLVGASLQAAPPPYQEETIVLTMMVPEEQSEMAPDVAPEEQATMPLEEMLPDAKAENVEAIVLSELGKDESKPIALPVVAAGPPVAGSTTAHGKHSGMGTPPVIISRSYPSLAEGNGFTGTIVLRVQILENGMPGNIIVSVSSGHKSLNDAAIAAAKKWRFKPAKDHDGNPMVCTTIMAIPFDGKQFGKWKFNWL